ncbi:hypothetical protein SAMN05444007_11561 [Cribrihabitans marinus]|uniref:Uncharacterized protein n=1 Tax=Cribrihabitans marinus TaxID=1227549 RepID=A0A1H7DW12_9RHOB|nr:hypothetical protein [Cribrihabitans marinus]GGH40552.1 hypothetical protein GCM10010973_36960 [Cribrihabitans marinus]SEK05941.1 hypothetical protein SAMN05444007_11561 [Cribrihabitans marinus]
MSGAELKASLSKARTTPMNFLLVTKGASVLGLIVRKKPIRDNEGTQFKTETKASAIHTGICVGGSGGLIFRFRAEKAPGFEAKLKKFIKDKADTSLSLSFEADASLETIDEDSLDLPTEIATLNAALAKLAKRASKVIALRPEARSDLLARLGEAKRLIQEISDERRDRVATAKSYLAELTASVAELQQQADDDASESSSSDEFSSALDSASETDPDDDVLGKGKGKAKASDKGDKDIPDKAKAELKKVYVAAVLNGDEAQWPRFHKHFSSASQAALLKTFGGPRGLTALGKLLNEVCGGDAARLRRLSDALD